MSKLFYRSQFGRIKPDVRHYCNARCLPVCQICSGFGKSNGQRGTHQRIRRYNTGIFRICKEQYWVLEITHDKSLVKSLVISLVISKTPYSHFLLTVFSQWLAWHQRIRRYNTGIFRISKEQHYIGHLKFMSYI